MVSAVEVPGMDIEVEEDQEVEVGTRMVLLRGRPSSSRDQEGDETLDLSRYQKRNKNSKQELYERVQLVFAKRERKKIRCKYLADTIITQEE